ncbi:MAG: FecR domain-containing protein [Rhodospirillaceae bacterium]|nr:FecR domain-containing protein [Rhodospirillaceae bacterium]
MILCRSLMVALLALCLSAAAALASPVAQVIRLTGNAELTRGGATAPLVLGAALEAGDTVRTDAAGRVRLQLIDGSTINLGTQSVLTIDDVISQGPGTERQVGMDLWNGALRALAAPATPGSRFEIRTPMAVTAVRGTEWGILASAIQSDVIILSGRVGVRRNVISGESAVSLTRRLGITVDEAGLGPIGRWSEAQLAEFEAATAVPGPEVPFNLGSAVPINLAPIRTAPQPEQPDQTQTTKRCLDIDGLNCRMGQRERDHESSQDHGGGESEHDSGNDSD